MTEPEPQPEPRTGAQAPGEGTLERGLRILQCFSAQSPHLGNRELAELTGLPRPTVSRLVRKLLDLGYLRHDESGRFEMAPAALCLSYPVLARLEYHRLSTPHLIELARAVDGVAGVLVRDRLRMVTLEIVVQRDVLQRAPAIGNTVRLCGTAAGLGWLAGATPRERERLLREVAQHEPAQLDTVRDDIARAQQQMADAGHVLQRTAYRPETAAVAMPLRRRAGEDVFVLSCVFDTPRGHEAATEGRFAEALRHAAARINDARFGG